MTNNTWKQVGPYLNGRAYSNHSRSVSLEEAIVIAKERVPGDVLKIELDTENGLFVYEIKMRTPQDIDYELEVDVYTGQIVKLKEI